MYLTNQPKINTGHEIVGDLSEPPASNMRFPLVHPGHPGNVCSILNLDGTRNNLQKFRPAMYPKIGISGINEVEK